MLIPYFAFGKICPKGLLKPAKVKSEIHATKQQYAAIA